MTESTAHLPAPGTTPTVTPGRFAAQLRDDPDLHGDAADLLLLDTAEAWLDTAAEHGRPMHAVAVLDDRSDSLTPALSAGTPEMTRVRRFRDEDPATDPLDERLLTGAELVLMPLPRSLETLEEWAALIARSAAPQVVVLAAGRDKHMTRSMNEVLSRHFTDVSAGRGRSKSRVLTARAPRRDAAAPRRRCRDYDVRAEWGLGTPLTLCAVGAVYGGDSLDPGTRFLLSTVLDDAEATAQLRSLAETGVPMVDLGCGNGTVAAVAALRCPGLRILATDISASAVASARLTAAANGVADRIEVLHDDGLLSLPDSSQHLILLNPPFHRGNAVDPTVAHRMIRQAGRALAPGGALYCVWNSHLRHRPVLEAAVGPTRQLARNPKFTVTVSTRPVSRTAGHPVSGCTSPAA